MIFALLLAMFFALPAPGVPATISVCQVGSAGEKLNGTTVQVTGIWRSLSGSGLFDELVDDSCPGSEIHVVFSVGSLPSPPPPTYRINTKSVGHAERLTQKALADRRRVFATIVGIIYVQRETDYVPSHPLGNGTTVPPRHKWYPFTLLIQSVPTVREI